MEMAVDKHGSGDMGHQGHKQRRYGRMETAAAENQDCNIRYV